MGADLWVKWQLMQGMLKKAYEAAKKKPTKKGGKNARHKPGQPR